ncbi:hypothetical protein FQR65_LT15203 [Abscondita terminalis]|nr:hypothetical protein FQR65_LT15203 [Abscondita terminalis]
MRLCVSKVWVMRPYRETILLCGMGRCKQTVKPWTYTCLMYQMLSRNRRYGLPGDGDLSNVEDFEDIIVKANTDGSIVLLKDVARVELGQFSYSTSTKTDGMVSTGMMINQTPGGNAVETADGIYKALEQFDKIISG